MAGATSAQNIQDPSARKGCARGGGTYKASIPYKMIFSTTERVNIVDTGLFLGAADAGGVEVSKSSESSTWPAGVEVKRGELSVER